MESRKLTWIDMIVLALKGLLACWALGVIYLHNVEGPGRLFWWIVDSYCECIW